MNNEKDWPKLEVAGKRYARNHYGEILVWRCASRRTGRFHWVSVRNPLPEVIDAFATYCPNCGTTAEIWSSGTLFCPKDTCQAFKAPDRKWTKGYEGAQPSALRGDSK